MLSFICKGFYNSFLKSVYVFNEKQNLYRTFENYLFFIECFLKLFLKCFSIKKISKLIACYFNNNQYHYDIQKQLLNIFFCNKYPSFISCFKLEEDKLMLEKHSILNILKQLLNCSIDIDMDIDIQTISTTITSKLHFPSNRRKGRGNVRMNAILLDFQAVKTEKISSLALKGPGWFTRFYQQQLLVERRKARSVFIHFYFSDGFHYKLFPVEKYNFRWVSAGWLRRGLSMQPFLCTM